MVLRYGCIPAHGLINNMKWGKVEQNLELQARHSSLQRQALLSKHLQLMLYAHDFTFGVCFRV